MLNTRLLRQPCTLILRSQAETTEDDYGNEIHGEAPRVDTVCNLQQTRREEAPDAGETSDTRWKLFLLPEVRDEANEPVEIDTGDAVEVDGRVYELIGDPWLVESPFTGRKSHVEVTCRRVAASKDE